MAVDPWSYAEKSGKEHAHQASLFMWANMACNYGLHTANCLAAYTMAGWAIANSKDAFATGNDYPVPQLKWLHAIHNQGHGDAIRGAKAKAEGVKSGVFDMFLPVPMSSPLHSRLFAYCGLYIELKVGKNQMSSQQAEFAADMTRAGYACEAAWGWLEARNKILDYLGLPVYPMAIEAKG